MQDPDGVELVVDKLERRGGTGQVSKKGRQRER